MGNWEGEGGVGLIFYWEIFWFLGTDFKLFHIRLGIKVFH